MSRTVPVLTSLVLLFCSVVFAQNGSVAVAENDGKTSALLRTEGKSIKVNGAIAPTTMTGHPLRRMRAIVDRASEQLSLCLPPRA